MLQRNLMWILWLVLPLVMSCATAVDRTSKSSGLPVESATPAAPPEEETSTAAEALQNSLKWSTASEVENFGFDIYRSTSENGPFERMTKDPIPGAGTVDEPQYYVWEDTTISPEVVYFYYIESISYAGVRERFSPVIRAAAKHRP